MQLITKENYIKYFKTELATIRKECQELEVYLTKQFERLDQLISIICEKNFWQISPEILGIDAKLTLLVEMVSFDDFSDVEIIRIVENDYRSYFKELCGYNLKMHDKQSMIFNLI